MAGVNTCVRGLIQNSGFDAMAIIAAVLNAAGHEVQLSTKTTAAPKTVKQKKRAKRAGKKAARREMEELATTEHPEWGMNEDYKGISDKILREALESGDKPRRKPLTGYMFFLGQVRGDLKEQGMNGKEIAKEAGRQWREVLEEEVKQDYKQQAIDDLEAKYGPQSASEDEEVEKPTSKKTRKPRKKAAGGGGGAKKTRKSRKKKAATPEPEDTPVAPEGGMFDSDTDSDSGEE
jgi:hypothetical protein